jgi:hypothetical protein
VAQVVGAAQVQVDQVSRALRTGDHANAWWPHSASWTRRPQRERNGVLAKPTSVNVRLGIVLGNGEAGSLATVVSPGPEVAEGRPQGRWSTMPSGSG